MHKGRDVTGYDFVYYGLTERRAERIPSGLYGALSGVTLSKGHVDETYPNYVLNLTSVGYTLVSSDGPPFIYPFPIDSKWPHVTRHMPIKSGAKATGA